MSTYQLTISGDSPDSLRENVQAWLDSREDGVGARFDSAKLESYKNADQELQRANVGDVVRRIEDGVKFRIDERVHPYVFSGVGSNGWREYGCKDGEYVIVERSERAKVGADTVYEATVWMQSGERLSQISTSTHPTFESAERRLMAYYDPMGTKIFAKKRTWEYDTDFPHAWSRKEENGLVLTIEQKEVRP